jgi:hypothetical protein
MAHHGPVSPPDEPELDETLWYQCRQAVALRIAADPAEVYEMLTRAKNSADDTLLEHLCAMFSNPITENPSLADVYTAKALVLSSALLRTASDPDGAVTALYDARIEERRKDSAREAAEASAAEDFPW